MNPRLARPAMPLRLASFPGALALLPLLAALAACGGERGRGSTAAVRDSAGVRIVENEGQGWEEGKGWRLATAPTLDVGVADGDPRYQFGRVVGALRLADGTVVVADGQSADLRFYDRAGKHVRTAGRKGGGPGEFQGILRVLRLPGDTVAVWDHLSSRLSIFSSRGDFVRNTGMRPPGNEMLLQVEGVFADGSLLGTPVGSRVFRETSGSVRDTAVYLRFSPRGAVLDTLGRFPGTETVTVTGKEDGGWAMRSFVPFGLNTFRGVHGDRLYVADNARFEIAAHDRSGKLVQLVRAAHEPQPLTREEIESYKREQLAAGRQGSERLMSERVLAATPFPKTKPAFANFLVGRDGTLWVREHTPEGEASAWKVFAPGGELLGSVSVPRDLRVTEVGADYLLGAWTDELDVPHVRLYALEKRGAAAPDG